VPPCLPNRIFKEPRVKKHAPSTLFVGAAHFALGARNYFRSTTIGRVLAGEKFLDGDHFASPPRFAALRPRGEITRFGFRRRFVRAVPASSPSLLL
jgi:hypothetical protein